VPGLNFRSAKEVIGLVARGQASVRAIVDSCLDRIASREPQVHAMAFLDRNLALSQAGSLDQQSEMKRFRGLVAGIKDVINTADMPTAYGSAIYKNYQPREDAICVSNLRAAGAVILCKTVTAEFAGADPVPTANPLDLTCTPGGSSSGSAAAVADGMTHVALSTQTGGSTIRPASYCGIIGFKPTFGLIDRTGIKLISESLDTVGVMGRDVASVAIAAACCSSNHRFEKIHSFCPRRFLICETPFWSAAEPSCRQTIALTDAILRNAGATVSTLTLPVEFETANDAFKIIMSREASTALAHEFKSYSDLMGPFMREFVRLGAGWSSSEYANALKHSERLQALFADILDDESVIVTPSAPGSAPRDRKTTGSPVFNSLWTMLHAPCVTIPIGSDGDGMPVGVQLVAKAGCDFLLLGAAAWLEAQAQANLETFLNQRQRQLAGAGT